MHDPEFLTAWAGSVDKLYRKTGIIFAVRLMTLITAAAAAYGFMNGGRAYYPFVSALIFQFILLRIYSGKRKRALETAYKYAGSIKAYEKMLRAFEDEKFYSPYLLGLKSRLKGRKDATAGRTD